MTITVGLLLSRDALCITYVRSTMKRGEDADAVAAVDTQPLTLHSAEHGNTARQALGQEVCWRGTG